MASKINISISSFCDGMILQKIEKETIGYFRLGTRFEEPHYYP